MEAVSSTQVKIAALTTSIVEAYQKGYTMKELAVAYNLDRKVIARILKTRGIQPRRRGRRASENIPLPLEM